MQLIKSQRDKRIKRSKPDPFFFLIQSHPAAYCQTVHSRGPNELHSTNKQGIRPYLLRRFGEKWLCGFDELPCGDVRSPLPFGHGWEAVREATAVPLCVWDGAEVSVTVTPGVSQSPGSLPLRGVCHRVKLDVALAPCVRESAGSWGRELLLLSSDSSVIFCLHLRAAAPRMEKTQSQADWRDNTRQACAANIQAQKSCFLNARKTHMHAR